MEINLHSGVRIKQPISAYKASLVHVYYRFAFESKRFVNHAQIEVDAPTNEADNAISMQNMVKRFRTDHGSMRIVQVCPPMSHSRRVLQLFSAETCML